MCLETDILEYFEYFCTYCYSHVTYLIESFVAFLI